MCKTCKGKYYMTTAIAYTSGKPHIGNTYEIVLADSIARYSLKPAVLWPSPKRSPLVLLKTCAVKVPLSFF